MISYQGLTKSFDDHPVLQDVSFSVPSGCRTALVGVNGSGKSTLLRITAGLEQPDAGQVALSPGATVAYVPQDYAVAGELTVGEFVRDRAGIRVLEQRLAALQDQLDAGTADVAAAYADALERYAALGGYEIDGRIERALRTLGLEPAVTAQRVATLSGGEQVRVGLAGVLASRFDVYLLDEPTNNLDLAALALLERFVLDSDATFLVVSHDRAFLDAVSTDVVELDEHDHTAEAYGVSYAEYRRMREQALAARSARYAAYVTEVARLQAAAAAKRSAAGKANDSRPARDNDKFARHFFAQRSSEQAAGALKRIQGRLDRMEAVDDPRTAWELRLTLDAGARSGDRVASLRDVRKQLGTFTLGPVSLDLHWQDRLALHGHNGAGKSLLLRLLTGGLAPDQGTVTVGAGVRFGVLHQGGVDLATGHSGLDAFRDALGWPEERCRTLLAKFDLGAAHVLRPVASYSPGERCRLGLAVLMAQGANCLVLDEPTNHLDLEATEQLEQAVSAFDGTLVIVSHDRELLARIGVTRELTLADGHMVAPASPAR